MSSIAVGSDQHTTLRRMAGAGKYTEWLLDRARPYLGENVLDVGAGIGTFTELIRGGRKVVALEPDPAFVRLLRERFADDPTVRVVDADASELPEGEAFDSIVCLNVLEHIEDDRGTLAHLAAALRPGGTLLLLVPAHPLLFGAVDRAVHHERRYRKRELRERLAEAGLAADVLRHVNPVGAAGWLVSSRLLRRADIPFGPLSVFDRLVPVLRALDGVEVPFGLSLWAVARRPL